MALIIDVEKRNEAISTVKLEGQLDNNTYRQFETKMASVMTPHMKGIILDLAKLDYISSAGLRVILTIQKNFGKNNAVFTLINLQPQIKKVFDIANALPDTPIFTSMEEADAYFDAMQKKVIDEQKEKEGSA